MSFGAYEILITDDLEIITVLPRAVKGLDQREIGTAWRENLLSIQQREQGLDQREIGTALRENLLSVYNREDKVQTKERSALH